MHRIQFLDSHTGGEPTRLILGGFPDLGVGEMSEKLATLKAGDHFRRASVGEPRSSDVTVGAVLTPPVSAGSLAGIIFFNNVGYLGMCGHGTIGAIASLAYLGRIEPGIHRLDTPAGTVSCELHADGRASVRNVVSYRYKKAQRIQLADGTSVEGDIAYGGNWFFLTQAPSNDISLQQLPALEQFALALKAALVAADVSGEDGAEIDHIELFTTREGAASQNFVLCPGGAYDRSPCGTGTSAKLACLAADGFLAPNELWTQQSIIGSVFTGEYELAEATTAAIEGVRITPTITGRAFVCAEGEIIVDEADAFAWGIPP